MIADDDVTAANAKSRAARQRLTATLVDIQQRLRPGVLLREAVDDVRDAGIDLLKSGLAKARDNPGPLIGLGAVIAAYISRDWFTTEVPPEDKSVAAPSELDAVVADKPKRKGKPKSPKPTKRNAQ